MTPARSLAASVIALGFASSFTPSLPALAAPASAPCERAENYAAQAGAEMLRIDRIAWQARNELSRPTIKSASPSPGSSPSSASSGRSTAGGSSAGGSSAGGSSAGGSSAGGSSAGGSFSDRDQEKGRLSGLTDGDPQNSGRGVTGFLSGASDLLKSVTNGGVTSGNRTLGDGSGSGGQGGGGPISAGDSIGGVGVGEARTALVAASGTNAAAMARMVDGQGGALSRPLVQQAPPNEAAVGRSTPAGSAGPLKLGSGRLTAHARWDSSMACGKAAGEASRSGASLAKFDLLPADGGALVRVPEKISSRSTTAIEHQDGETRTVAMATVTAGRLSLINGEIKVRVVKAPSLTARMGSRSGGSVDYRPAVVEVSGPGIGTKRLSAAGQSVDISLGEDRHTTESLPVTGMLSGLSPGAPLPLPSVPGLPSLGSGPTESAPSYASGCRVRVALGRLRQAQKEHAIAAKAMSVEVLVSANGPGSSGSSAGQDHGGSASHSPGALVATLGLGLLEAAAVTPGARGGASGGGAPGNGASGGGAPGDTGMSPGGGGLPVTGSPVGLIAAGGVGLLAAGGIAMFVTRRARRPVL